MMEIVSNIGDEDDTGVSTDIDFMFNGVFDFVGGTGGARDGGRLSTFIPSSSLSLQLLLKRREDVVVFSMGN